MESRRHLPTNIKTNCKALGSLSNTDNAHVVNDNDTSAIKFEKTEEGYIKKEQVDTQLQTNYTFSGDHTYTSMTCLDPSTQLQRENTLSYNQVHKNRTSPHKHTDLYHVDVEETFIKKDELEETPQDRECYNNILQDKFKKEHERNNSERESQPGHNTEKERTTPDMKEIIDLCFMCTKDNNCVLVDDRIVSQVDYLLPEITIIKLGLPLRICSVCDGALCAFSKFKQSSVESSRRLEARIKGAQGPPLHTGSPPVVDDNEVSDVKPETMEDTSIKEEYVEETPLDTNNAFLDPISLSETISAEPHNQLHEDRVSQNIQLHTDTNTDITEEIKQEQMEEIHIEDTSQESDKNVTESVIISPKDNTNTLLQNQLHMDTNSDNVQDDLTGNLVQEKCTSSSTNDGTDKGTKSKIMNLQKISSKHIISYPEVKSFQCFICQKEFSLSKLHLHMKSHSGVKDFSCEICEKSFKTKSRLLSHTKIHYGVKNYPCSICNKLFREDTKVKKHMKIHSQEFRCNICNRIFVNKIYLDNHIKTHAICIK